LRRRYTYEEQSRKQLANAMTELKAIEAKLDVLRGKKDMLVKEVGAFETVLRIHRTLTI